MKDKVKIFILSLIISAAFSVTLSIFAAAPAGGYLPGETLDPDCAPGDTDCLVRVGNVIQGILGTQVTGQIPFWTGTSNEISRGGSNLFWDNTNGRLGVGTSSPTATFQINGSSANSATQSLFAVVGLTPPLTASTNGANIVFLGQGGSDSGGLAAGDAGGFNVQLGDGGDGAGEDAGQGGAVTLESGDGGSSTTNGGHGGPLTLASGNGGDGDVGGDGGDIQLTAGNGVVGTSINGNGGNILLLPGSGESKGNVGIGLSDPSYPLHVKGDEGGVVAKFETASGATSCTLNGTTGLLACSSDRALKKDIVTIDNSLASILKLEPVSYLWATEEDNAARKYGFIAQDVEPLFPMLVSTDPESGTKLLSTQGFIPFMIEAIQELNNKMIAGAGAVADGLLTLKEIVADKFTTKELCIEDVCITKDELAELLKQTDIETNSNQDHEEIPLSSSPSESQDGAEKESGEEGAEAENQNMTPDVALELDKLVN